MEAVSWVFPFRVNTHVIDELIHWSAVPDDPIYRLVFPQPGMLLPHQLSRMQALLKSGAPKGELSQAAREIQGTLNPNPAGQRTLNVPRLDGRPLAGVQHKYRETVLFFPSAGQTCHTYCTYCFRWSQFAQPDDFRFEARETEDLVRYLEKHPEVNSLLITGGDPLVMSTSLLRETVKPLLSPTLEHLRSIRIGTKSLSYWPHRFVSDSDADDLLRLFGEIRRAGKHVALMAHVSHPRELEPDVTREAIRRIQGTGAVIRTQAPLIRGVNDDADTWSRSWRVQTRLGLVPYYLFMARDTGARHFFQTPLAEALAIYNGAIRQVSGLARTARGPVMSANPGKVLVDGVGQVGGKDVFVLKFLQGRDPRWAGRVFFARFDPRASWLDELRPIPGETEFFFEPRLRKMEVGLEPAVRIGRGSASHPIPYPGRSARLHVIRDRGS